MEIIPAIDLLDGKVVRLTKGDARNAKVYSTDPLSVAHEWKAAGAKTIHVVDLSAALGQGDNSAIIEEIVKKLHIDIQVGGGIRDLKRAKDLIALGCRRIIIGTRSTEEDFLKKLIEAVGVQRLAIGVDVKDGFVAIKGWQEKTSLQSFEFLSTLQTLGVIWVIYTDVSRDGTLTGFNGEEFKKLGKFKKMNFIVSGGAASIDDLHLIIAEAPFVRGVILGKALYEGKIDLKEAISLANNVH